MWCPLIRFIVNGSCDMEECFQNTMNQWYDIWLSDHDKLSTIDRETIEEVLKTWFKVMWNRGPTETLEEGGWEEAHASFSFGVFHIKTMVLFMKKRSS